MSPRSNNSPASRAPAAAAGAAFESASQATGNPTAASMAKKGTFPNWLLSYFVSINPNQNLHMDMWIFPQAYPRSLRDKL